MKPIILTTLLAISCVPSWWHTSANEHRALPSVWGEEHGTIEYVDNVTEEKSRITKYWAQEASGSPESVDLIRTMEQQGFSFHAAEVGVLDEGFEAEGMTANIRVSDQIKDMFRCNNCSELTGGIDKHGVKVSNLITGYAPVGISSRGVITMLEMALPDRMMFRSQAKKLSILNKKLTDLPSIVNYSYGSDLSDIDFEGSPSEYAKRADEIIDQTIFVPAAGNSFPKQVEPLIDARGNKMVVVGSADPTGFVSNFSQADKHVTILAMSDNFVQSRGEKGLLVKFGGTSGAAPQVSGALADFVSIVKSPTRDEVTHVLQKTAIKTSLNEVSELNGAGLLNQYKMLRVAKRLAEEGWPENRELLYSEKIYDFTAEAKRLTAEAEKLISSAKDADYGKGFKKLRQAFFLDADNAQTRTLLANMYRKAGHITQALFYDTPTNSARHFSIKQKIVHRSGGHAAEHTRNILHKIKSLYHKNDWAGLKTEEITLLSKKSVHDNFKESSTEIYSTKIKTAIEQVKAGKNSHLFLDLKKLEKAEPKQFLVEAIEAAGHSVGGNLAEAAKFGDNRLRLLRLLLDYTQDTNPELMTDPRIVQIIAKYKKGLQRVYSSANLAHNINYLGKYGVWSNDTRGPDAIKELLRHPEHLDNEGVRETVKANRSLLQSIAENMKRLPEFTRKILPLL